MVFIEQIKRYVVFLIVISLLLWAIPVTAQDAEPKKKRLTWKLLETRYMVLKYQTPKDLHLFDRQVKFSSSEWGVKGLFAGSDKKTSKLTNKVDAVYVKAQEILDMKKRIKKITVKIYPKEQFISIRSKIAGAKSRIRSWYIYKYNTIYANAKDIHEGILAHEMAHGIIDNYLDVKPPRATAEILARHVDKNLHY